jgi:chondroitin AC lyase
MILSLRLRFSLIVTAFLFLSIHANADDFEIVRDRVVNELLKASVDARQVEDIMSRMKPDGSYPDINYEDLSRTAGFPHRRHTSDLVYLARAYQSKTTRFYHSRKLKAQIVASLKYWVDHDFVGDNWHCKLA